MQTQLKNTAPLLIIWREATVDLKKVVVLSTPSLFLYRLVHQKTGEALNASDDVVTAR